MYESELNTYLHRISNTLMINGGFLGNSGLYSGEMGLVLFFYHYARSIKNEIYSEYGANLFRTIQNKISLNTPINYKLGLSGIGSTIEYLVQNGFMDANIDEMLEAFDQRIFLTYNLPQLPIDIIVDFGYYALWRMAGNSIRKDTIIKPIMLQIIKIMKEWQKSQNIKHPTVSFFKDIVSSRNNIPDRFIISDWLQLCRENNQNERMQSNNFIEDMTKVDLGIQNGLAGLGLSLLSEMDGNDSYISLFPNDLITSSK